MMFVLHRKHRAKLSVRGKDLLFYMKMIFVPHRKYRAKLSVRGKALLYYMQMMFVPHRKHRPPQLVIRIVLLALILMEQNVIKRFA
jgi:hypothetical protein